VENPAFDSQSKENLTSKPKSFGSPAVVPEKLIKQVSSEGARASLTSLMSTARARRRRRCYVTASSSLPCCCTPSHRHAHTHPPDAHRAAVAAARQIAKDGLLDRVTLWARFKAETQLKKAGASKKGFVGVPKLDDANFAGTSRAQDCTLILTEGDSAKALAVAGVSVVGRDLFGVFPLKGKLLNVRDCSVRQVLANAVSVRRLAAVPMKPPSVTLPPDCNACRALAPLQELKAITEIVGLKYNTEYTSTKGLRYGRILVMAGELQ
jgi:DNA gyrase/topoisomerase IV subunit B